MAGGGPCVIVHNPEYGYAQKPTTCVDAVWDNPASSLAVQWPDGAAPLMTSREPVRMTLLLGSQKCFALVCHPGNRVRETARYALDGEKRAQPGDNKVADSWTKCLGDER